MKNYLVPSLADGDRQKLKDAGVPFEEWSKGGILVSEAYLNELLETLEMTKHGDKGTKWEGVRQLKLRPRTKLSPAALKRVKAQKEAAQSQARATYMRLCRERIKTELDKANSDHADQMNALRSTQSEFVQIERSICFGNSKKDTYKLRNGFLEEIERLREIDRVLDVRMTKHALHIFTDVLFATNPGTGKRHEIGKFMITIYPDGRDGGLRWINSTRRVDGIASGMNAPGIFADGTARVDEIRETLLELLARCEFATVAELAIQFVETVPNDEFGKSIENWPLAQA